MPEFKHKDLTNKIICCFYNVYNKLGYGFLEKVYENALLIELESLGLATSAQHPIEVAYSGQIVGQYFADILVENKVIIEIKATRSTLPEHESQLLNYLKATSIEVGLLLNFGPEPKVIRKVLSLPNNPDVKSAMTQDINNPMNSAKIKQTNPSPGRLDTD